MAILSHFVSLYLIAQDVKVKRVIDGDTFEAEDGEKIRLLGVDCPELAHFGKPAEYFGKESTEFSRQNLEGKTVKLVKDSLNKDRDKYGRLLRYVYINKQDFSWLLIEEGYGYALTTYPISKRDEYERAQNDAREGRRGVWNKHLINKNTDANARLYWLNMRNNVRHNEGCKYFQNTKDGKLTPDKTGIACNICGG